MVEKGGSLFSQKNRGNILRFLNECISRDVRSSNQDSDAAMAILMDRYLEAAVMIDHKLARELTSVLRHVYKEVSSRAGLSVRKHLLDPGTSVLVLRGIKEHHQRIARTSQSEPERRVATAIYFAAIAAARKFHRERITSFSDADLRKSIGKLLEKPWLDPELKALFQQADALLKG